MHYHKGESVINPDSTFFLAKDGHKNPEAEFAATIQAISDKDNKIYCEYPARTNFIISSMKLNPKDFDFSQCPKYQEFLQKVPMDTVAIVFAAENNQSPSSILGHSFLKISGQSKTGLKEHSFSYFAAFDTANSIKFYIDVMTSGIDGAYILSPYRSKADEYVFNEKRSLWEFELDLSEQDKQRLKDHLWELKGKNIHYKFVTHNCNTALISILKVANPSFETQTIKPFITPVEYVQDLYKQKKIKDISIEPTVYVKNKINQYGVKNILSSNKSSRIDISYVNSSEYDNILFQLSPVYQDIKDINSAYYDDIESKIGEVTLGYNIQKKKVAIQNINILKMQSILDYSIQNDFSKYFRLALENSWNDVSTHLKPTVEFGLGYGKSYHNVTAYFLPKIGYRYNQYGNFYLTPEIGLNTQITENIKLMTSYAEYFDSKDDNRGYGARYSFYVGYKFTDNKNIYLNYKHYTQTDNQNSIIFGFSQNF